jgi:ATP-dependent RNA helicase RhlE
MCGWIRSDLVLGKADRMLDMGFIRDVRKIVAQCPNSARPAVLGNHAKRHCQARRRNLAQSRQGRGHAGTIAVDRIDQGVYFVPAQQKRTLLTQLLKDPAMDRVLVFTRTKHGADKVCRYLSQDGETVEALHGNKAQNARVRALDAFKSGRARILVATDIAARGIDVQNISHVSNYELPNEPESYVHRIGRTARAGKGGAALSFCDGSERPYLRSIERLIRREVPILAHDLPKVAPEAEQAPANGPSRNGAPHHRRPPRGRPGQGQRKANGSRPHAHGQKSTHRNASRSGAQH